MKKKYALIIGGELRNKGAQAMTFIAVSELRKRFPSLTPVLVSSGDVKQLFIDRVRGKKNRIDGRCSFEIVWGSDSNSVDYLLHSHVQKSAKQFLRRINTLLEKKKELQRLKEIYEQAAICLDVSGYAFGDKWGFEGCINYLRRIESIINYKIPLYIMPQSFGPFNDFSPEEFDEVKANARQTLPKARIVMAREKQGYCALKSLCPDACIRESEDLVLQGGFDPDTVLTSYDKPVNIQQLTRCAGIVPNIRNQNRMDPFILDKLYRQVIDHLLSIGFQRIYIIRHSSEDLRSCERIKSMYEADDRIALLSEDLYCFEYAGIFRECSLVIASRFHAIVHCFREGIPCIALGWAVKYRELLERCGQDGLAFDVTSPDFDPNDVLSAVDRVIAERDELSNRIMAAVAEAQQHNVFDIVEEDFKSLQGGGER